MAQRVLPRWRILGTRQTGKGERAMTGLLCVGAGGALGAMGRYSLGLIPLGGELPLMTLLINFLGSVAIGAIVESLRAGRRRPSPRGGAVLESGPVRRIHDVFHLLVGNPRAHRGLASTPSPAPTPWSASFCASPACWPERCSPARSCRQARRQKSRVGGLG